MADKLIIDCSTGEESTEALTTAEEQDRATLAAESEAAATAEAGRTTRREQAAQRLRTIGSGTGTVSAADTRFIAKVLAVVVANMAVDPDA